MNISLMFRSYENKQIIQYRRGFCIVESEVRSELNKEKNGIKMTVLIMSNNNILWTKCSQKVLISKSAQNYSFFFAVSTICS